MVSRIFIIWICSLDSRNLKFVQGRSSNDDWGLTGWELHVTNHTNWEEQSEDLKHGQHSHETVRWGLAAWAPPGWKQAALHPLTTLLGFKIVCLDYFFLRFYLFIDRGKGREKERERNINVWLPLVRSLLGRTWPTTQACALTRNWTSDPLVCRPALNPLSHTSWGCLDYFLNYKMYNTHKSIYSLKNNKIEADHFYFQLLYWLNRRVTCSNNVKTKKKLWFCLQDIWKEM